MRNVLNSMITVSLLNTVLEFMSATEVKRNTIVCVVDYSISVICFTYQLN